MRVGAPASSGHKRMGGSRMEQESATERKRILVSDDEPHIVKLWQSIFERAGYETRTSLDPFETLELAQSWRPHVITTDILKPGISGLEMIRRLKADDQTKQIPVVVVSARPGHHPEQRERALEAGACAVVVKPVDPTALLEAVADALNQ